MLFDDPAGAVVEAHGNPVVADRAVTAFGFVAGKTAEHGAADPGDLLARAFADLMAEHAAEDRAANGTEAGAFALLLDGLDVLDHAAVTADGRCGRSVGNAAGGVQTFTVPGPVTLTANTFSQINVIFTTPITVTGLTLGRGVLDGRGRLVVLGLEGRGRGRG